MSDQPDTDSLEADVAPDNSMMQIGAALKSTREQHDMTVADVCTQLRISPHQVKALESDDFAALPETMITRGFIRNYARLLGIDAEPLLQAYRAFTPSAAPYALALKSENILITGKDKRYWLKYIVASVLIALLLGSWQFYMDYIPKPSVKRVDHAARSPNTHADTASSRHANTHADTASSAQANTSTETDASRIVTEPLPDIALPAAERVPDEAASAAPASNDLASATTSPGTTTPATATTGNTGQTPAAEAIAAAKLKLSFSQTSWVNVRDQNKKIIFDKIMPAGSEETIEGQPPLEVVIGNARGSNLMFNDKPVDLAPYTKSNVARITLE